ncbi:hypothetical protein IV203_027133 [Nitzschia inconspicua]|uniref:DUF6824 domain-containing protein n=1 Tax=Nitzschia inconspicua TaxID=303405 RepID=A0A9K3LKJ0_9STRA|nr:hypothetical protein IV203_027133 [Nitzschia inconspicua]
MYSSPRKGSSEASRIDCRISSGAIDVSHDVLSNSIWSSLPNTLPQQTLGMQPGDQKLDVRSTGDALSPFSATEEKPLPNDFKPSEFTVIIGRGKRVRETIGNIHLRTLATTYLSQYADALKNRQAKTEVVNNVLGIIRAVCPNGGAFVRCDNGQWYEVSDRVAREKVGYVFRDLLSDSYESSCKSKTAKRKRQQKDIEDLHQKDIGDAHRVLQQDLRQQSVIFPGVARLSPTGRVDYEKDQQQIEPAGGNCSSHMSAQATVLQLPPKPRFFAGNSLPYLQTQGQQQTAIAMMRSPQREGQPLTMLQMQYHQLSQGQFSKFPAPTNYTEFSTGGVCLGPSNAFAPRQTPTGGLSHEFLEASTLDASHQNSDSTPSSRLAIGTSEGLSSGFVYQSSKANSNELLDVLSPLLDGQTEKANKPKF